MNKLKMYGVGKYSTNTLSQIKICGLGEAYLWNYTKQKFYNFIKIKQTSRYLQ